MKQPSSAWAWPSQQAQRDKAPYVPTSVRVRLPTPHPSQEVFVYWPDWYPEAQVLVAPCGTKVGKSFGAAIWLSREAMLYPSLYCLWVAPTLEKAKIGYRYVKAMLPEQLAHCRDQSLDIRLANNTYIKFTHGRDAEVVVEGEAVDRFVMDEAGKQKRQLWYSLFTTITQTLGLGILTGTPRGLTWYAEVFRQARAGDKFFAHVQLQTDCSPYVSARAIDNAKRILPAGLFAQYYLAQFVSDSDVFGDMSGVWFRQPAVNPQAKLWLHPDKAMRMQDTVTGLDLAKRRDFTVMLTTNLEGTVVGYWRFRGQAYTEQGRNLVRYLSHFGGDRQVRYDATGVGEGFGDIINEMDIDAAFTPVLFTNASKQEMVTRSRIAIESDWWHCPYIEQISHEFAAYELKVSKSGLHTFSASEGEHDDCVSAAILSISGAFQSCQADRAVELLENLNTGKLHLVGKQKDTADNDPITAWANMAADDFEASIDKPDATDSDDLGDQADLDELAAWEAGTPQADDITSADEIEALNTLDD